MPLAVRHLNCATMCPPLASMLNEHHKMVCHCLLIESPSGLILVDTAIGTDDLVDTPNRLGRFFPYLVRPAFDRHETAIEQIRALGYNPNDVRHILLTHLDPDHAGGLSDFPDAQVHVYEDELHAMQNPTRRERLRYHPAQYAHNPKWVTYRAEGEPFLGFSCVRDLAGLPTDVRSDILLVPVIGHTRGHCAVAVRDQKGWLLHCGDAYFYYGEMEEYERRCTPLLRFFQRAVEVNHKARKRNQERLRQLAHSPQAKEAGLRLFCAHDPTELSRFQNQAKR